VDEFLDNAPHAVYFAPRVEELKGAGETIGWRAIDGDAAWTITLGHDGYRWSHEGGTTDCTVEAAARDLYLMVWGRLTPVVTGGDPALLEFWRERASL
ncbi:MAG: maleylpyruvate isomerase family mycothiol-dependent enzyme, partial [Actinomycetota bacterium]